MAYGNSRPLGDGLGPTVVLQILDRGISSLGRVTKMITILGIPLLLTPAVLVSVNEMVSATMHTLGHARRPSVLRYALGFAASWLLCLVAAPSVGALAEHWTAIPRWTAAAAFAYVSGGALFQQAYCRYLIKWGEREWPAAMLATSVAILVFTLPVAIAISVAILVVLS